MHPLVIVLVGPIASGKSTRAAALALNGAVVVNDDALVQAIHAGRYVWDEDLKPLYKAVENCILTSALLLKRNVVIDRPNHSEGMRRRYIGIAKAMDARVIAEVFPRGTPEEQARRRHQTSCRGRSLEHWLRAARRHEMLYEPPALGEGFDEVIHHGD